MIKKLFINFGIMLFLLNTLSHADKLKNIQDRGYIKVGLKYNAKPMSFKNRTGRLVGFEVDLVKEIAKSLKVKTKFVEVTSANRFEYVLKNKIDIALATATHTIKRDANLDFSISYFYSGQIILSRKDVVAGSYKDFEGKKIGATIGSTSGAIFEVIQPFAKVVYFKDVKSAIAALKAKKIDGVTNDYSLLVNYYKSNKNTFKFVGKKFTLEPYGISMKENESNLRDEINFAIQDVVKTGKYDKIYRKWFGVSATRKPVLWP